MATRPPDPAPPGRGALRLVTDAVTGAAADQAPQEHPPAARTRGDGGACTARIDAARELFATCTALEELPDGYAFHFAGDEGTVATLLAFVATERRCCRFLAYELALAPGLGPAVLRLRGDADGKRFVYNAFVPAGP